MFLNKKTLSLFEILCSNNSTHLITRKIDKKILKFNDDA